MGEEFNIADLMNEYSDSQIEFGDKCLDLSGQLMNLAERFGAWQYENLLQLQVNRVMQTNQIIDYVNLENVFGTVPSKNLGKLRYLLETNEATGEFEQLHLPSRFGNYMIEKGDAETMIGELLVHVYEHCSLESFKIIGIDYFSFLKTTEQKPFIQGTYFCSKTGDFVLCQE